MKYFLFFPEYSKAAQCTLLQNIIMKSREKTNKFDKEALMIADINELFMRSALH